MGGAAAAHMPAAQSPVYADQHQHQHPNSDLAAQIRLQQLQNQHFRYAQPQQRHVDINSLFPPGGYGHAPAANMSAIPVSGLLTS